MNKVEKKKPRRHEESFKRDAARLMSNRQGKTVEQLAKDLGVTAGQLYNWEGRFAHSGRGAPGGLEGEPVCFRKEDAQLREERDVLKKATAFFVKASR